MKSSINVLIIRIRRNCFKWVFDAAVVVTFGMLTAFCVCESVWWIQNLGQWALSKTITIVMPIGAEILGEHFIQLKTVHQKIGHISLQNEMLIRQSDIWHGNDNYSENSCIWSFVFLTVIDLWVSVQIVELCNVFSLRQWLARSTYKCNLKKGNLVGMFAILRIFIYWHWNSTIECENRHNVTSYY